MRDPIPNLRVLLSDHWSNRDPKQGAAYSQIFMLTDDNTGLVNLASVEARKWFAESSWRTFTTRLFERSELVRRDKSWALVPNWSTIVEEVRWLRFMFGLEPKHFVTNIEPVVFTTSPGYVYLAEAESGHYKIGRSSNPQRRVDYFDKSYPFAVRLLAYARCDDAASAEAILHNRYAENRTRGEWFLLSEDQAKAVMAELDRLSYG